MSFCSCCPICWIGFNEEKLKISLIQTAEGRWYSCGITPGVDAAMESDSRLILPCRLHLNTKAGWGIFILSKKYAIEKQKVTFNETAKATIPSSSGPLRA